MSSIDFGYFLFKVFALLFTLLLPAKCKSNNYNNFDDLSDSYIHSLERRSSINGVVDVADILHKYKTNRQNGGHKVFSGNQTKIGLNGDDTSRSFLFNRVLHVNKEKKTIIVEAGCTMRELLNESLKHGLVPLVLPEFGHITVGGAIVGGALETSSFKYGQFSDICSRVLVMTGDKKKLLSCSREENIDLFLSLPGSYGTLGTIVCAEIQCTSTDLLHVQTKEPIVKLKVETHFNISEGIKRLVQLSENKGIQQDTTAQKECEYHDWDFIESIVFRNPFRLSIITGKLVTKSKPMEIFDVEDQHEEFFYEKIERLSTGSAGSLVPEFCMTLKGYIFRYERGAFWMAKPIEFSWPLLFKSPMLAPLFAATHNNWLSRKLFRSFFTTSNLYKLLHSASPRVVRKKLIIMDIYSPAENVSSLLNLLFDDIPLSSPIWLCPVIRPPLQQPLDQIISNPKQPLSPHGHFDGLLIDVGIYGRVPDDSADSWTRELDQWTMTHNARKMLYSQHTFSEQEFWMQYDKMAYDSLRAEYSADTLPDLYDKVCKAPELDLNKPLGLWDQIVDFLSYLLM